MENHWARRKNHGKFKKDCRSGRDTLCAGELNFDALREFGEVTVYDRTAPEDVAVRIGDAQIVLTNKALITARGWNMSA